MAFVHDRAQAQGSGDRRFNRTPGAVKAVRLLDAESAAKLLTRSGGNRQPACVI